MMTTKPTITFIDPWKPRMSDEEAEVLIPEIMPYVINTVQELYGNPHFRKLYDEDWQDALDESDRSFTRDDFPSFMVTSEVDPWLEEKFPGEGIVTWCIRFAIRRIIEALYLGKIQSLTGKEAEKIAHDDLFRALVREGRWAGTIEPFDDPLHKGINPENIEPDVLDYIAKHAFYLAQRLHDDPVTSRILAGEGGDERQFKLQEEVAIARITAITSHAPSVGESAARSSAMWIVKDYLQNKIESLNEKQALKKVEYQIRSQLKFI